MDKFIEIYKDNLIYVFNKQQLIISDFDYLVIVKDKTMLQEIPNTLTMYYQDDFESLLKIKLPTKIRNPKKLISLSDCFNIMKEISYGVLSFTYDDLPYSTGLNHIMLDGNIYFHCANSGYKLNCVNKKVTYMIINDLGINLKIGTHNYKSTAVFGTMLQVTDFDRKKAALLQLINDLAPNHPYHDDMVSKTNILELKIDYVIGKAHIY